MLICYSEHWLSFLLFCLRSPRQSLSFCSVNSWFGISARSYRDGDQVQLGLLSKERVHSKAALQMGSPCYAPGDPHGAGVQESPASLPNSLFYLPVSPGLAEGMETLPWPLLARAHFCVLLSRTAPGSPLRPGGLCSETPALQPAPGVMLLHHFNPTPCLRSFFKRLLFVLSVHFCQYWGGLCMWLFINQWCSNEYLLRGDFSLKAPNFQNS